MILWEPSSYEEMDQRMQIDSVKEHFEEIYIKEESSLERCIILLNQGRAIRSCGFEWIHKVGYY